PHPERKFIRMATYGKITTGERGRTCTAARTATNDHDRPHSVEQILSPLIVRPAHEPHNVAAGVEVEGARFAHQLHAGFEGELIAFAAIAEMAACHQVFPGGGASARAWNHVVERQLA